ncbi:MAG: winged helix-turn-helix domain-containing protein [Chloroflexi bacterium]|nr:winged helix-turn-helix domain-containing protein [Chloroflexota bacterium]
MRDGTYMLRDLGSKNGTSVNGQRVDEVALHEGDEIEVPGGTWVYRRTDETLTLQMPKRARISVDAKHAEVRVDGREIAVTARELLALAALAEDPGALVTKDDLARKVRPETGGVVSDDSIEQLISRLRRKLGDDAREPRYLLTVRGLGYRLFSTRDAARR